MTWFDRESFPGEVGKSYRVDWEDCCTSGWFVSTLLEVRPSEDGSIEIETLVFEHGEVTEGHVVLTPISDI